METNAAEKATSSDGKVFVGIWPPSIWSRGTGVNHFQTAPDREGVAGAKGTHAATALPLGRSGAVPAAAL
jgi:hypothetical protein